MSIRVAIRSIFAGWHAGLTWRMERLDVMLVAQYEVVETMGPASGMVS